MLLNLKCSHFYGSKAWEFIPEAVRRLGITWNKAMRKLRRLPTKSHHKHLVSLNMGSHAFDVIHRRICNMTKKVITQDNNNKM